MEQLIDIIRKDGLMHIWYIIDHKNTNNFVTVMGELHQPHIPSLKGFPHGIELKISETINGSTDDIQVKNYFNHGNNRFEVIKKSLYKNKVILILKHKYIEI